jgi:hypothetical protein
MFAHRSKIHFVKRLRTFLISIVLSVLTFNTSQAQDLVANPGFESGTDDWFSFGPASFNVTGGGHSGNACAGITLPNGVLPGIGQLMSNLQTGQTYVWSAWVRLSPTVPPPARSIRLNLYYTISSTNYVKPVVTKTLTTTWEEASAAFDFNASGTVSNVMIGIDGASPSTAFSFFLDDVSIVNSSPALAMERTNNSVLISWPSTNTGYSLERKSTLSTSSWTAVTDPVQTNGSVISVALSATNSSRFFRLKK